MQRNSKKLHYHKNNTLKTHVCLQEERLVPLSHTENDQLTRLVTDDFSDPLLL